MKTFLKILVGFLLVVISVSAFAQIKLPKLGKKKDNPQSAQPNKPDTKPLTNEDVINLWKNNTKEELLVSIVKNTSTHEFTCDSEANYKFAEAKVPLSVAQAVCSRVKLDSQPAASVASTSPPQTKTAQESNISQKNATAAASSHALYSTGEWLIRSGGKSTPLPNEAIKVNSIKGGVIGGAISTITYGGISQKSSVEVQGIISPAVGDMNATLVARMKDGRPEDLTILPMKVNKGKNKREAVTGSVSLAGVNQKEGVRVSWTDKGGGVYEVSLRSFPPGEYIILDGRNMLAQANSALTFSVR